MRKVLLAALAAAAFASPATASEALERAVKADYDGYLAPLFGTEAMVAATLELLAPRQASEVTASGGTDR